MRAEHRRAADAQADLRRVVVDEARRRASPQARPALDLLEEADARRARADDQRQRLDAAHARPLVALAHQSGPRGARRAKRRCRARSRGGTRSAGSRRSPRVKTMHGEEQRRAERRCRARCPRRRARSRAATSRRRDRQSQKAASLQARRSGQRRRAPTAQVLRAREVEAQREGDQVRGGRDRQVARHGDRRAVTRRRARAIAARSRRQDHGRAVIMRHLAAAVRSARALGASTSRERAAHRVDLRSRIVPKNGSARQRRPARLAHREVAAAEAEAGRGRTAGGGWAGSTARAGTPRALELADHAVAVEPRSPAGRRRRTSSCASSTARPRGSVHAVDAARGARRTSAATRARRRAARPGGRSARVPSAALSSSRR